MAIINQPSLLPGEFASDGDKNVIPANNDGLSGLASIAKGFPPITQQPLASGGLPPQRADFNGIFNLISQFLLYSQNGGVFTYSATLDYNPPAMVGDSEGNIYICIAQNGPNTTAGAQATSNVSYWVKIINTNSLTTILNEYVLLSGGNMTGILNLFAGSTVTTPSASDNSNKIANTQWVQEYIDNFLVGNIIYRPFLENGYVKLNGATVQREDYPRLIQYATDNNLFTSNNSNTPWLFGQGDGETTFVLPDYRNVFIEGGDTPSIIEAGLPNIEGEIKPREELNSGYQFLSEGEVSVSGAFNVTNHNVANIQDYTSKYETAPASFSFNASLSNSIYGNSETVQPPAIMLIPQIKY